MIIVERPGDRGGRDLGKGRGNARRLSRVQPRHLVPIDRRNRDSAPLAGSHVSRMASATDEAQVVRIAEPSRGFAGREADLAWSDYLTVSGSVSVRQAREGHEDHHRARCEPGGEHQAQHDPDPAMKQDEKAHESGPEPGDQNFAVRST